MGAGSPPRLVLGADGVQLGTAFLRCPEAVTSPLHRAALAAATDASTVVTNVITGRPARSIANRLIREVGPIAGDVPPFPLAAVGTAPLRAVAEAGGSSEFSALWSGQAVPLGTDRPAGDLVRALAAAASDVLGDVASRVVAGR